MHYLKGLDMIILEKKVYNCIKKILFLTFFSYLSYITAFYI